MPQKVASKINQAISHADSGKLSNKSIGETLRTDAKEPLMKAEEVLTNYAAGDRNFSAANLSEANLSGANLSKANLNEANLSVANLSGANLSEANLAKAKLNVARLSGTNLSKAVLKEAILNVANLTLADLSEANLNGASLVRAELTRADLSAANLNRANFSGADLKDAKLRNANLTSANLSRADLKWTVMTGANLNQANLHGSDLSSSDCSGADFSHTELRQANMSRANLRGANLTGANLRWADLSGADLSWADLSGARLSGANLTGANLTHANLLGTTLVHVDLTRANLIGADWAGSDLSGATLTGAKLHDVLRFGVKTEGIICEWVDLSANGDQSSIYRFTAEDKDFFHETSPTVCIVVDDTFSHDAHYALAVTYRQVALHYQLDFAPPNIQVGRRRTTLTFKIKNDHQLFLMACAAILPFKDAAETQKTTIALVKLLQSAENRSGNSGRLHQWSLAVDETLSKAKEFKLSESSFNTLTKINFFLASTKTTLINSSNQTLNLYNHSMFGKRVANLDPTSEVTSQPGVSSKLPAFASLIEFLQGFHTVE